MEVEGLRIFRQRPELQRDRDQHALRKAPDARHKERPDRELGVNPDLVRVLVLEPERVEPEAILGVVLRSLVLEGRDHRLAAAGIAGNGVDRERIIGRDQFGFDKRPQKRDGAGRIAAGIADAGRLCDRLGLAGRHLREPIGPIGRDAVRARSVDDPCAVVLDESDGLARRVIGQAKDRNIRRVECGRTGPGRTYGPRRQG